MSKSVFVYDPTANDELSRVRGIGRYLQILKENFSSDWTFTNNIAIEQYSHSVFINPFFNFLRPPLLMRRLAKKQIAVIHDLIPIKYPDHFPAGIKGKINIFLNKLALKNYDLIITDSEASKKDIVQVLNQPEDKVKVVYPCLPKLFLDQNLKSQVSNLKTKSQNSNLNKKISDLSCGFDICDLSFDIDKFCLYVGDATWNKNLVNLAKALKIINLPCIFVGRVFKKEAKNAGFYGLINNVAGVEEKGVPTARSRGAFFEASTGGNESETGPALNNNPWQQELNEFNQIAKNDKRFIFAGFIPDEKLINLYQKARLNILVSRDEGFGFSYFEAASQSCPSVLSNIPVLKETAGNTALFADPNNPQDIADKINELFSNEPLRNQLGQKAKERLKNFSPQNFKKSLVFIQQ